MPGDRAIDGVDLAPLLLAGEAPAARPVLFYAGTELLALREGDLKVHRRRAIPLMHMAGSDVWPTLEKGPWLFDLARDPDESYDLSGRRPDRLAEMLARMDAFDAAVDRNPRGWR